MVHIARIFAGRGSTGKQSYCRLLSSLSSLSSSRAFVNMYYEILFGCSCCVCLEILGESRQRTMSLLSCVIVPPKRFECAMQFLYLRSDVRASPAQETAWRHTHAVYDGT